jgi:hypothetical protein
VLMHAGKEQWWSHELLLLLHNACTVAAALPVAAIALSQRTQTQCQLHSVLLRAQSLMQLSISVAILHVHAAELVVLMNHKADCHREHHSNCCKLHY